MQRLKFLGSLALSAGSLVVAAAALAHAASEVGLPLHSAEASLRLGLNAEVMSRTVDRAFLLEMKENLARGQAQSGQIPEPLVTLARRTFLVDPLEISNIRTLALGSVLHEDGRRARKLMQLAARISKRDPVTNLWLAQDYGRRGDGPAMLASFDHALRTSRRTREAAMPLVVNLLADPSSYAALGRLLDRRPEWETAFWQEFVGNPVALRNSADFFSATSLSLDRLTPWMRSRLYFNLKSSGQFDVLGRLAALDPASTAAAKNLAAGRFEEADGRNPLDWTLRSQGNYVARVHEASGELQIDARPGSFGIAAERIFPLDRPYELNISMAKPVPPNAALKLAVICASEEGESLANIDLAPKDREGQVRIAAGACAFGNLQLSFTVDPGRQDAFIRIASITLRPA